MATRRATWIGCLLLCAALAASCSPYATTQREELGEVYDKPLTISLTEYLRAESRDRLDPLPEFQLAAVLTAFDSQGRQRTLVVEEPNLHVHPGMDIRRVRVFDDAGWFVRNLRVSAGWRKWYHDWKVRPDPSGMSMLEMPIAYGFQTTDERQYYAFDDDRLVLLRVEDAEGKLLRNIYRAPNLARGGAVPHQSFDRWRKVLASGSRVEILEALTWLGGEHLNPGAPLPECVHEDVGQARLVQRLRKDESVRRRVAELAASKDAWLREAAMLADKAIRGQTK